MSSLTIENILSDIRSSDDAPESLTEKTASVAQDSFSDQEIESMTELLKQAEEVQLPEESKSQEEKVAEMLLFSAAVDTLADTEKYDAFRKEALNRGHKLEDVDDLIEKKASASFLKNLTKKQIAARIGAAGVGGMALTGAGAYQLGKSKQKKKTKAVAHGAFRAGRLFQNQRHQARVNALKERIMNRMRGTEQGR
jgi:hypothetical protein